MKSLSHFGVRWFLRGLGFSYMAAFWSLATQVEGLFGEIGILPLAKVLPPSLVFSDRVLEGTAWAGAAAGALVGLGVLQLPLLILTWLLYWCCVYGGQEFLSFQWDTLLLEAGFLALFICPFGLTERQAFVRNLPRLSTWLPRWLLAKLMFQSGAVKLLSGDLSWRELTALTFHFETQPLPNAIAWYTHHLPAWLLKGGVVMTLAIELLGPVAIFCGRRARFGAFCAFFALQFCIIATGNYGFFNFLTLCLCMTLLDDGWAAETTQIRPPARIPRSALTAAALAAAVFVGGLQTLEMFGAGSSFPTELQEISATARRWMLVNRYGLFAVMTTERREIELEGSKDGNTWVPYVFKYKPGPLDRPPPEVPLHMPRLDWQMWFAALGTHQNTPWLLQFVRGLLEDSEPMVALLEKNPFPEMPPKFVRARLYVYHFTTEEERARTGAFWRREPLADYMPPMSLKH